MNRFPSAVVVAVSLLLPSLASPQGTVYLVLGSDTGIWEGMDVSRYHCTYALGLFVDPARNATRVMDPSFRSGLQDSYGTPVKLTWWMMAGNIFRYATNTNVPHPNTLPFYLMQKYHGAAILHWGDELTFHYHTWVWTDYNGDGKWYWNQAKTFPETADDFDETLAEILLNEHAFPISFRSGWHAMDNYWQARLDQVLPYSLHNDWPAKRAQTTEPIDNVYDWSRAPSTWIPFHPSPEDYQVPGAGRGWNVRSEYMASADSTFMAKIFAEAAKGIDQVVCLWAHLPEADFPDNIAKVNTSAHKVAPNFPGVPFRYCTAVEAMQAWRHTADTTRPTVTVEEYVDGAMAGWTVRSDEPLFQPAPIVAVKDRYEQYRLVPCAQVSDLQWQTAAVIPQEDVAAVGVAATDTAGNSTLTFLYPLPEEVFVDDEDTSRVTFTGAWSVSQSAAWGRTSRFATLVSGQEASFRWTPQIERSALYNIFVQVPPVTTPAQSSVYRFWEGESIVDSVRLTQAIPAGRWFYVATRLLGPSTQHTLEIAASGSGQAGMLLSADVVKYSPLVRTRWLDCPEKIDAGEIIVLEENRRSIMLQNQGLQPVTISSFLSTPGIASLMDTLPAVIPPMGSRSLTVQLHPAGPGPIVDTIAMTSDDPRHARVTVTLTALAREYFTTVDDRDSLSYFETGAWSFSVAQAYGPTSRYAYPASNVSAMFLARPKKAGLYEVQSIVPTTANATPRARYVLSVNGIRTDTLFLDQNNGSGSWVLLFRRMIPASVEAGVSLSDAQTAPIPGRVLRADAIRFQWVSENPENVAEDLAAPLTFELDQNFPNPFNPSTVIRYQLPIASDVRLVVYDLLGREVALLVHERQPPGTYEERFEAKGLSSGVYICRLTAGSFSRSQRMLLLR